MTKSHTERVPDAEIVSKRNVKYSNGFYPIYTLLHISHHLRKLYKAPWQFEISKTPTTYKMQAVDIY